MTDQEFLIFDRDLNPLKNFDLKETINEKISWVDCCRPTFSRTGYLLSFAMDVDSISPDQYVSVIPNLSEEELWAWVARCTLDDNDEMVCKEPGKNSIVLEGASVNSMLEFAQNKLILHLDPTDLLIVHDWIAANKVIKEISPGNDKKYLLRTLPGFDEETYPFVVASGSKTINLINVKENHMQIFVNTAQMY